MMVTHTLFLSFMIWSINTQNLLVTARSPTQAPAEDCFEQDIAYPGNDVGAYTSPNSAAECQITCQKRVGCNVWTYSPPSIRKNGRSACFTKRSKGKQVQKKGKVSGPKNCPAAGPKLLTATFELPCQGECKTGYYVGGGRHDWCNTTKGWDYCSKVSGTDYRANACTTSCEPKGEKYNWCRIASGSWGYCSILAPEGSTLHPPSPTTAAPVEGLLLPLGTRCNSKSPPCDEPNSACITYRCKCVDEWVRYPRNGDTCVAQNRLELGTPCTTPGSRCSADNSECRAFRCFCKLGFTTSAAGDECIPPMVG